MIKLGWVLTYFLHDKKISGVKSIFQLRTFFDVCEYENHVNKRNLMKPPTFWGIIKWKLIEKSLTTTRWAYRYANFRMSFFAEKMYTVAYGFGQTAGK